MTATAHARILAVVRRIPRGRVATYGQVAELAGLPRLVRERVPFTADGAIDLARARWRPRPATVAKPTR